VGLDWTPIDRLDLSIRFCTPAAAPSGAIRLFTHSTFPVCTPALLDQARLLKPSDLKEQVLLHASFSTEHKAYVGWDSWLAMFGLSDLRPRASLYFNHYEQAIQAALQGQGVALGIDTLVGDLLRDARLVAPFPTSMAETRNCYVVVSAAASRRSEVEAFIGWLLQEAGRDEARRG
jgi:LysR family transcriptional regulator, glycine cleavage system transcriptional activator